MSNIVYPNGTVEVSVPATESIAVYTTGTARVFVEAGYPNFPTSLDPEGTVTNTQTVFGPYTNASTIIIQAGASQVLYEVGVAPVVLPATRASQIQPTPVAVDVTGAVSATAMLGGIVTSTVMDAATEMAINDSFDWSVIATGANAFTVTAAAGHTIVGGAVVATVTSGLFRTRKTAANTFVTYRLS